MSKAARRFAVGTLVAAAVGYVAGVLTAPKSGKETRKDIKKGTNKVLNEGEKTLKKLLSELNDVVSKAETKLKKARGAAKIQLSRKLKTAKKAKQKVREILSALHDGDADDRELKAAVKGAKSAKDHLKKYIKV